MGNHEFCEKCHENDFHLGRPCDPKKVAKVEREKKERFERRKRGVRLALDACRKAGIPAELMDIGGWPLTVERMTEEDLVEVRVDIYAFADKEDRRTA